MDARNDLKSPIPKLCHALEAARRTDEAVRTRTSQEFLAFWFPHDQSSATDRVFVHLPKQVRGPMLSSWGIRGKKSALVDSDEKVRTVIHDALLAGDIDHVAIEQAITPEILIKFVPLQDWWSFWRGGKLSKRALHLVLTTAAEVGEIDAPWFWSTLKSGDLTGTDALASFLSKDELVRWIKTIHQTGDGSAQGLLGALGWQHVVEKVEDAALLGLLDALASKMHIGHGAPPPATERHLPADTAQEKPVERKSTPSSAPQMMISRKPEPTRPPEASLKPGSRASQRPPAIPIEIEEPTSEHGTDEYPLAEADALKRLTRPS